MVDLRRAPYFDDYEEAKKYYRILFRPSMAVQARELTQTQTIQQKQIERFGDHIFKNGSVVEGCSPTILPNLDFIRVTDQFSNSEVAISNITSDFLLVGQTSNVRAVSVVSQPGALLEYPDTNRFYVKYLTTGINDQSVFSNNEIINIYSPSQNKLGSIDNANFVSTINVITTNSTIEATGKGYGFSIENGIIYHKGFFQLIDDQTIIIRDYDQDVGNYVVGFETNEEIVTENQDESLTDNALGYSNENAPGAHRLKLTPVLISRDRLSIEENESFFAVYEFSNVTNSLVLNKVQTPYDEIGQALEKRTYDESGDYVVKPFITETVVTSNSSTFAYQVSSGKAYVHGAQIEYLTSRKVEADRAITTFEANQQIITTNYGNYVFVDEYAGALNFNELVTVDIYDTAFDAITNRYTPSLGGKNKIGEAKVKSVLHFEGDPGLPNTQYRVFLTDIVMDTGKSFSADAKSIYANSSVNAYGDFYADLVLLNSKASLQESGKSSLVFPFGKKAIKTLRSSNGSVNNTEFYFRVASNATLQTNGFIAVTTSSSYTGGVDRLGYSTGILGDVLEDQFIVTVTSNVSTANISGTIDLDSTNTTILTSGLNTSFANGEFIKIYANSSTIDFRRVVSVNSTAMVIDTAPSVTNSTADFAKHFPAGYTIPLDNVKYPGLRQVNVTSNTTFQISTGAASAEPLESSANVNVQYRMLRVQATQARKDVRKNRYVKLLANSSTNNSWNLGLSDVIKIKKVFVNASSYSENDADEVTNYFTFDNGQKSSFYDHGKLILQPQYTSSVPINSYITVVLDHFSANLNNGIGFFSVDSYPIDDVNLANTNAIQTAEIPVYYSDAGAFDLRDCVDFRNYKANTANSATTLATATQNPATTNNFISLGSKYLVEPDTNFQSDIEYYLGRIDLVTLSSTGSLGVVKGAPAETPRKPAHDTDTMVLATASVPPYPTLTTREAENFNRLDYSIRTSISTNRGYTMKDIGLLDKRIERLEYYTTLNLLEQKAQNIQVPDSSGLNRFKNGIFADPMSSHIFAESSDIEYRFSIDSSLGYGRPLFSSENVDLKFDINASSGVTRTGKYVTRPYTNELFIFQPFATKFRNNTQDVWSWRGSLDLFPQYDMNRDETRLPNIDTSIDLTQPFIDFNNTISRGTGATVFGTRFGDWRTVNISTETERVDGGNLVTVTQEQQRAGTNTFIVPVSQTFDLGTFITDVSVQPYMKSRNVAFIARNLKPNTRVYAYFDDVNVSVHCAPATLNTALGASVREINEVAIASGSPENVCTRTGNYGDPLITSEFGTLFGVFRIPEGEFRTGDRQFHLFDVDDINLGNDAFVTKASAVFTASSIAITSRNATITTTTPSFTQTAVLDTRTFTDVFFNEDEPIVWQNGHDHDPIGQSFSVESSVGTSGIFVTKMDLFFKRKDPNLGITLYIAGMKNNSPDSSIIYGMTRVEASEVVTSDDASLATEFRFSQPIFLSSEKEYSFYVVPEGNSPEYLMWMSEIGGFDVTTNSQVFKNIFSGNAFRSSNARTWLPLPTEDVKFNLYVANFQVGTGTAVFENEDDEYITYSTLGVINSSRPVSVGDEVYLINSVSNAAITNTSVVGKIQFIDTTNNKLKLNDSTGGFSNGSVVGIYRFVQQGNTSQADVSTLIATATIQSLDDPVLHAIVPRFATAVPSGTTINYDFRGTTNSAVIENSYHEIVNDNEREMLDFERRVYSYSSELDNTINDSLLIRAFMTTNNKYISPVIDLSRKSALLIKNIINNNNSNEHTRYGESLAKYISQPIVLADGQEAEDLKIYLSAYRPINTEVEVYVKFLNNEDSETIETKVWTKLVLENPDLRSSPINRFDFKEYVYNVPTTPPVTNAAFKNESNFGILEYTDDNSSIYQSYKTFVIKIVLLSSEGIYVPKINDLRGIALQV
jgi:hypothetical protein